MRYLIAETVALKPHLETAGEIALKLRAEGHEVVFTWLGNDLPWSDWHLPRIARLLGCSLSRREWAFEQVLKREDIRIEPKLALDPEKTKMALEWAGQFDGDLEALKRYSFANANLGMGAASSLISFYGNSFYDPRGNMKEVRQCLATAALVFERARYSIAQVRPDEVVTFNGRFVAARPIVTAAEMAGLRVLRHERGSTFARYELFTDAIHNYAYIRQRIRELWERAEPGARERVGHEFFRRRRGGDGIGWYSYTADQDRGRIPPKAPGKRRVVFFHSSDDEYACATDVFDWGAWPDQLLALRTLAEVCAKEKNIELVLRIHPHLAKKSVTEQQRWLNLKGRDIHVIAPDEKIDSYALLDSADIVVSYGSTIGMEAAYWGKPSVLMGPGAYVGSPAVSEPKTIEELARLLKPGHVFTPIDQALCLPYGHYYLTYGTPYRFYQPSSLSEGSFLGERLGWDSDVVYWLRQHAMVKKMSRYLRKRK
jgi:hypothetical protein